MPYDARLQTNEPWFIQIQRICGCENPKPYVSKPLSNSEIRRVYRNEYYRIEGTPRYLPRETCAV